jgi:hypothetical protein
MNSPCEPERKTKNKAASVLGAVLGAVAIVPN